MRDISNIKTQSEFVNEIKDKLPKIEVLGKYINSETYIECKCTIDGYVWSPLPSNLLRGHGCPVCAGRIVKSGINDMLTTHPEIKTYLLNIEDGLLYTAGSHKHINFICPCCNNHRNLEIKSVINQGFSCPICGDGISYPNKFARCFLKQLDLSKLEFEYHPDWAEKYFYDNYFVYNKNKYILEMDGMFHYKDNAMNNTTKEDAQNIDKIKDELAKQNNITVIRIDCRKSDPYFIEKNIRNSLLNNIFDLSNIDWNQCNQYGHNNLLKEICDFYQLNKTIYSHMDICKFFSIGSETLSRYLKIGTKTGWIKDDIDKSLLASIHVNNPRSRKIIVKDILTNKIIYSFKSINLCIKYFDNMLNIKLNLNGIRYSIKNKNGVYKGYKFEYV